ncbi:MAG: site-specific integrase [Burkholderiales bacterium]|nr:site-specific integrase [Burkholderiales bacterium]
MARRGGIQERRNSDGSVTYRAQVRMRGAPPLSKSFSRKTAARAWIEQTRTVIRGGNAPSGEAERTTLREALERYLREPPTQRKTGKPLKGWSRLQNRVKAWMVNPLAFRFLSQLRGADFASYRDERRKAGKAESTIRIELALISKLYNVAAREWGMEGLRNPIKSMTLPGMANARERTLQPGEEGALLEELQKAGAYMAPLAELAIETAMRQGELLALTWGDVDLPARVARLKDTKNTEPRDVPLSTRAVEILKALPRSLDSTARVFPVSQDEVIRTFRGACVAAKIEDLRFHDLRHEAVTRICKRLPMHEAMRVSGHKTPAMLMRYYHPKAEDLARKLA